MFHPQLRFISCSEPSGITDGDSLKLRLGYLTAINMPIERCAFKMLISMLILGIFARNHNS